MRQNLFRAVLIFMSILMASACSDSNFSEQRASSQGDQKLLDKERSNRPGSVTDDPLTPDDGSSTDELQESGIEAGGGVTPDGEGSEGFFDTVKGGKKSGDADTLNRSPRFAMLVNDLKCGMCHTQIHGDVASTNDVNDWSEQHVPLSNEVVSGGWYAAKSWTDQAGSNSRYKIDVRGGVQQNYVGNMVPNDPVTRKPAFPQIDFGGAESRMQGRISGSDHKGIAVNVSKVLEGNLVIFGTQQKPIKIEGSVLIKGDLVLKGYYTGIGSIYVTGNIYIPANLKAEQSVFPYPSDYVAARQKGRDLVRARQGDALGLATAKNIFIGDLATRIYDDPATPASQRREVSGIDGVYAWLPGGQGAYAALYEPSLDCQKDMPANLQSFNLVEAYLYAAVGIGGISRSGSWMINGGIITDVFNVLGTVSGTGGVLNRGCPATLSSVHGAPQNANYINYDFRMSAGLRILGELAPYFR